VCWVGGGVGGAKGLSGKNRIPAKKKKMKSKNMSEDLGLGVQASARRPWFRGK